MPYFCLSRWTNLDMSLSNLELYGCAVMTDINRRSLTSNCNWYRTDSQARVLFGSQVVYVACLCRMSGADTTGRHGDVATRSRCLWRDWKSHSLSHAMFCMCAVRRRTPPDGRRAVWDTAWPRILSGTLLWNTAGEHTGAWSCDQDCDCSSYWHERSATQTWTSTYQRGQSRWLWNARRLSRHGTS